MANPTGQPTPPGTSAPKTTKESIQDTIVSVIIAFALAFVFRGFVVEAFVIPTGSMAPTLMGAHERIRDPDTGYAWPVGPWDIGSGGDTDYLSIQGATRALHVHDPMSGQTLDRPKVPLLSGDRILVLKYLYTLFEPKRFDVVVFKFKRAKVPEVNYIKRLTGLPGEEIALVDGDIFYRKHADVPKDSSMGNRWEEPGWHIARKAAHVQAAMWQRVFDSDFAPRNPVTTGRVTTTPWRSDEHGWSIGDRVYEYTGGAPTELSWDSTLLRFSDRGINFEDPWEIDDRYPYDETPVYGVKPDGKPYPPARFPVSDLRMGAGILPGSAGLKARATIVARSHEFQMEMTEDGVVLRMRRQTGVREAGQAWQEVARAGMKLLTPNHVTNVFFCQVDQSLEAWINGKRVCKYEYDWSPAERIAMATGASVAELLTRERPGESVFGDNSIYKQPRINWSFEGAPFKLYRVSLDRDIYYQPANNNTVQNRTARGSRPDSPMVLNDDQFFVCGDNSPQSEDARFWEPPDPFVRQIDPTEGVVPRKMMLGKAFFVYFPALHEEAAIPVPDFGRMRFIW